MHVSANPVHAKNLGVIERWASIVGGASLIGFGMKKRSAARGALALLGGDLIYSGLTGYSHIYKALGIRQGKTRPSVRLPTDKVQIASEDSFPASDAPAWNTFQ